ncbi:MAG: hypothetical protein K0R72_718 [Clostridia bacterium]|jgi:DNA helicase HerA-like ATPase|nr:hypothetical protein [Clostridia bacterium]
MENLCAQVISVDPDKVKILVNDMDDWKTAECKLKIGSYLEIKSDDDSFVVIAIIENFKIDLIEITKIDESGRSYTEMERKYVIDATPLGIIQDNIFRRGGDTLSIPPKTVNIAEDNTVNKIFTDSISENERFCFATLSNNANVKISVNGNKFFNKHIAIVGSSGSGKSNTTAKIIQNAINVKKQGYNGLNNSHIVIFDIHSEYQTAFPDANKINIENLVLPYWLLSGDELEEIFLDTGDNNNYNQSSLLRNVITINKQVTCGDNRSLNFDSPTKFNVKEIYNALKNFKIETHEYYNDLDVKYKNREEKKYCNIYDKMKDYFKEEYEFQASKTNAIKKGPYADGTIDKFINRFHNKITDNRLDFLFGERSKNITFIEAIQQFIGYREDNKSNVTIIDLSGVPFDVLSITVSLISRILFDFAYSSRKNNSLNSIPLLLVFEEAHKYVPKSELLKYKSSRNSIERIAKEGRKYGITLVIVSQRPSEVSETIFSQCNTFVAMRLTNPDDQNYVKRLLPDTFGKLTAVLSTLSSGEALLIGESIIIPSIIKVDKCELEPSSSDIMYLDEWRKEWLDIDFQSVTDNWKK